MEQPGNVGDGDGQSRLIARQHSMSTKIGEAHGCTTDCRSKAQTGRNPHVMIDRLPFEVLLGNAAGPMVPPDSASSNNVGMRWLVLAVALSVSACGKDSPTSPSGPGPASLAGTWGGTFRASNWGTDAVGFELSQTGATVNGTWATTIAHGTIAGTVTGSTFAGTFTITTSFQQSAVCTGSANVSGPVGGSPMQWTTPSFSGNCAGLPANVTFTMER